MDQIHSDVWMQVLSFVNILDASRGLSFTSKRLYYLVHQYQALVSPELAAGYEAQECLEQLSRKPTLVLTFDRSDGMEDATPPALIPSDAILLGAQATGVQANLGENVRTEPGVMMASIASHIEPFVFDQEDSNSIPQMESVDVIIVYVCGDGYYSSEWFVSHLQSRYPSATIVGGICEGGHVGQGDTIRQVESGIFGIMARNMPVKSVVSRGVKSVLDMPYKVHEVQLVRPRDEGYIFVGMDQPYHRVTALRSYDGTVTRPVSLLARHQPDFCGVRREGSDGFELNVLSPISLQTNTIILITDGSQEQEETLENAELDLFSLDGEACKQHMDWTLAQLAKQTQNEVILGAVMYSCNGRGPETGGLMGERMADATRFHKHFPKVPCLGFYAGGEIGSVALAGHENVFQRGKAAVQGFTAVFAVFVVPAVEQRLYNLDDSDQNVAAFVRSRLGRASHGH